MGMLRNVLLAGAACALLGLGGCSLTDHGGQGGKHGKSKTASKAKKADEEKTGASARSFVENLTLARLELLAHPEAPYGLSPRLNTMRGYLAHGKSDVVKLVVLDFTVKGSGAQSALVPISLGDRSFAALTSALHALEAVPHTLSNVRLLSTQPTPDANVFLPDDPQALRDALDAQQRHLLAQYSKPAPQEEISTQLALIDYFTTHRQQDAAYLTLENTKRLLAEASQKKTLDDAALSSFTTRFSALESTLKQRLPYTF